MVLAPRRLLAPAFVLLGAVYVAWLGFGVQTTGDYPVWFAPAANALLSGHVVGFLHLLPDDGAGGSLILRLPGALVGKALGLGQLGEFRYGALECVLILGGLGLWLARGMRLQGRTPVARAAVIGLCVMVPALLDAIYFGHPEEPLGAALCVGAVLLADGERPGLAGLALGLAIINKPWGVLAIAPALLAAPRGRWRLTAVAGGVAATWFLTTYLAAPSHFAASLSAISPVAHPEELWWPIARLSAAPGTTPYYFLPGIVVAHARELAVIVAMSLSLGLVRAQRAQRAQRADRAERAQPARRSVEDCLALLALAFLLRCLLDPSDHIYYHVPFVVALIAWEARTRGAPVLALLTTGLLWLVFHTVSGVAGVNVQFAAYVAVTVPLAVILFRPALGLGAPSRRGRSRRRAATSSAHPG